MGAVTFLDGLTEIQSAVVDHSLLGDNTIIPAVPGKRVAILGIMITVVSLNTVQFFDGPSASGNPKTGGNVRQAGEGYVLNNGGSTSYWFLCSENSPLVLKLSSANNVNGLVVYRLI